MLNKTKKTLFQDERGLSTMEYAVLFVMIVVGTVALWNTMGQSLADQITAGQGVFDGAMGEGATRGGAAPGGGNNAGTTP